MSTQMLVLDVHKILVADVFWSRSVPTRSRDCGKGDACPKSKMATSKQVFVTFVIHSMCIVVVHSVVHLSSSVPVLFLMILN